ncbi:MAG: hypothetical protein O2983_13235 [Planctomycetota bacterium]|nr:hypothetical protein [Planctomycetota bacterium]MDA0920389.1 hypothetical protein [Planctomycetota bacterium]MDA1160564.1 hypothetical protein [Planctomycetota bacterium]
MATCFHRFLRDESGLVITAELIMIITIAVISLSAGWGAVASMLAEELEDVANSVGSLNQSYNYRGISAPGHASCSGGGFNDSANLVNVSTSSNFNASVAGLDFTPLIPTLPDTQVNLAGEPFVLIEEEFGVNAQVDTAELLVLEQLDIVEIREDGAVLLLREDLVEIQEDGSLRIVDEELRVRVNQLRIEQLNRSQTSEGQVSARAELTDQSSQADIVAARKELEALKKDVAAARSGNVSDELRQENARLRELIERLCKESQTR